MRTLEQHIVCEAVVDATGGRWRHELYVGDFDRDVSSRLVDTRKGRLNRCHDHWCRRTLKQHNA